MNFLPRTAISLLAFSVFGGQAFGQAEQGKPYEQDFPGIPVKIRMVPIPAGEFLMGSPVSEKGRHPDEGPQVKVKVDPFWMSETEITHDQFFPFRFDEKDAAPKPDAVSRPTAQYIDLTWGMGKEGGFPANSMQPYTALTYCKWLWKKTGIFYRLPTEAEWEYACRAGSKAAYPAGVTAATIGQYAWYESNSKEAYHKVKQKKPNAFGLYDMLGNVAEWTMDMYDPQYFQKLSAHPESGFFVERSSLRAYHTARGGSFKSKSDELRSADRLPQVEDWNQRDPQMPRSKWWMTDGDAVGIRLVRPVKQPTKEEAEAFFEKMVGKQ
ncbi:MAG: SUMF1/EgtB/PvdO family nonheme iron enzyme [Siphonobacter aquaeclarae]|nr:SUMF1/EgtB/PvdO family nonheme iron enzyme [Siphonobacter aquaeclarae]